MEVSSFLVILKHSFFIKTNLETLIWTSLRWNISLASINLVSLEKTINSYFLFVCSFSNSEDLFENPLADEPDYRLRVIYALPSVKIFDRHGMHV